MRPTKDEAVPYYQNYIDKVDGDDFLIQMSLVHQATQRFIKSIDNKTEEYSYAVGKWSIREIIGHLMDTERVFNYRALRFARGDELNLHGFDHDKYVPASKADGRLLKDLAEEFQAVRMSTISLFQSFDEEMLAKSGTANDNKTTVNALGFIIVGHEVHHIGVIKERYLTVAY
ncbi:MAG: DinB family protein [Flavobacteriales bacterium]|nr:DinB family protein [Flavobacteriales bacterium]